MMLSKNEVKYIQSLYHKKQREQQGLFIAEGPKLLTELLTSNFTIETIYATAEWLVNNIIKHPAIVTITAQELERISNLQTPNQVVAIVRQQTPTTSPNFSKGLTLALDGIQDPGNLGTIIRIADWFGITQIICSHDTVELYNPKVIQSTMGSFLRTKLWYQDLASTISSTEVPVFGALLEGASIYKIAKPKAGILVIGSEGSGISKEVLPYISNPVTIPRIGGAESLNAAVATGIIVSHLV